MPHQGVQDFELLSPLGSGRCWSAFKARTANEIPVELRLMNGLGATAADLKSWIHRWRLISLLKHAGVRQVLQVVGENDQAFCVLESVPEESCAVRHHRHSLTQTQTLQLGARVADGLVEAHRLGIVVGPFFPEQVFDRSDNDWMLDLTVSLPDDSSVNSGDKSAVQVNRINTAPEILAGDLPDSAGDVYALCEVLRFLCEPWLNGSRPEERRAAETLARGLAFDPDRRPKMNELSRELADLANSAVARSDSLAARTITPSTPADDHPDNSTVSALPYAKKRTDREPSADPLAGTVTEAAVGSPATTTIPETLGRFRLHERLGAGATGSVFRATDLGSGNVVAVKVLNAQVAANPVLLRRFAKEARMLAQAESPFVANLIDSNRDNGRYFLAIEFVSGGTLSGLLHRVNRLTEFTALRLVLDAARGLEVAHTHTIVHRDIKPENMLLTSSGSEFSALHCESNLAGEFGTEPLLKLSDFGLARADQQSESLEITHDGAILGTPLYMSPEQCRGQQADSRSDVYSLGATLFHMLAGRPPFQGENHIEVMNQHCQTALPSLRQLRAEVSDGCIAVVEKCLAKNPDARYSDASALLVDLQRLLHGAPSSLQLHPATPAAGTRQVVEFHFSCDLTASPAALWPYVSHTDRVNHAVGLPTVTYTTRKHPQRGVETFAEVRVAGQRLVWQEHPYEWIEGRRLSVLREFSGGPFLWFMNIVETLPASGGGTRLTQTFRVAPRNWIGRILAKLELGRRSPKAFSRVYHQIDGYLRKQRGTEPTSDAFGAYSAMTASGKIRLRDRLERLSSEQIDPVIVETLRQFLEHASDLEVARIRPLVFAERFGLKPEELIDACLLAARDGILVLLWDILCPSCRIPADVQETLASLKDHAFCPACDLRYEIDFASSVELIFRVHPEVRTAETRTYCIGGPAFSAHVVAQIRLAPDERFELELMLNEGSYRLRGPQLPFSVDMRVSAAKGVTRFELPLLRPPLPNSVPVLRQGAQVVTLHNNTSGELQVRLERTSERQTALTAAAAASIPLFREMFPEEVLAPGQIVSVANLTLLLAEFCGAKRMYQELGDGPAFGRIRGGLQQLEEVVCASGGAVVKIVGEGIVATFSDAASAVRAAATLLQQSGADDLRRRLAIHRGSALVTTLNNRLDYFGETVHIARQLLESAQPEELLLTASTMAPGDLTSALQGQAIVVETAEFTLPESTGILWRCIAEGRNDGKE